MSTARARRTRLRKIMREHSLSTKQVAVLVDRSVSYVRNWRSGLHPMPAASLRLLELELEHRARTRAPKIRTVNT